MKLLQVKYLLLSIALVVTLVYGCGSSSKQDAPSVAAIDAEKLFAFQVYPLLKDKCFGCHGDDPEEIEGDFDMRSRHNMLQGGESGKAALVPGNAGQSPLYFATTRVDPDFSMPPKENDQLEEDQIEILKQWINGGAPWPDEERRNEIIAAGGWDYQGKVPVATSGGLSGSWTNRRYKTEDIWAFQHLKEQTVPWEAVGGDQSANPIDAFLNQKLKEYQLEPAPEADKRSLIRRASYDLTGLPPTSEEIDAFLTDDSPEAFAKVVDRLLASPHYGEQWGRHWLDVVRYADSDGFANDYMRPNAWRYRDYVIRAFNEDKPYNQFVLEQVAGDEIDPGNPEMLIATGFLRMGPWEHTGMSVEAETRQFFLDDVTNSVGEVFLSQPLRCASCHDHKFDPIPTRDYYNVQAVFATTQFAERPAPYLAKENLSLYDKEKERIKTFLEATQSEQQAINEKEEQAAREWFVERGRKYLSKKERRKLSDDQQPPRYYGLSFQDLGYRKVLQKRAQRLNKEMGAFDTLAYSVYTGPGITVHSQRLQKIPEQLEGDLQETFILSGGSVYAPSEKVSPGVLSAFVALQDPFSDTAVQRNLEFEEPVSPEKRRLYFARWLAHPDNALTTRSIVNRIWQYHFGKGIAENANNFGATGKKPTHPELLDWLAAYFVNNGWSIKQMHRLVMNSVAYQRSTQHPDSDKILTMDPDNKYLAVFSPRRLAAEEIRDAMLFVSGELNPEGGGMPVRPEIHQEVALQPRHVMGSIAPAYQPSPTPKERNRRSIYTLRLRGLSNPMMEVFNQPGPNISCEKRSASSVTPQVFMLFNDKIVRDRAIALGQLLATSFEEQEEQIAHAFEWTLNRPAKKKEIKQARKYLGKMLAYHHENPAPEEAYPVKIHREMFEEMTGEAFEYVEELEVYKNFQSDLKAWQVAPETRALADLALVLFNTNEFLYVY